MRIRRQHCRAAFLREHRDDALAAIEKETLRRRKKKKTAQSELRILEPDLWSLAPDACWQLELRILEKQGSGFHLLAPDEPESRATFETVCPDAVQRRKELLASLTVSELLFPDEEEDEAEVADEEEDET